MRSHVIQQKVGSTTDPVRLSAGDSLAPAEGSLADGSVAARSVANRSVTGRSVGRARFPGTAPVTSTELWVGVHIFEAVAPAGDSLPTGDSRAGRSVAGQEP